MTPLLKLTHRLNEAFPERLELKFGCEVDLEGRIWRVWRYLSFLKEVKLEYPQTKAVEQFTVEELDRRGWKILGTPPTLAEVLRLLCKRYGRTVGMNAYGDLLYDDVREGYFGENYLTGKPITKERQWAYCRSDSSGHLNLPLHLPVSEWPDDVIEKILELTTP